ncbi:MAG: hypothetical protein A2135_10350 [Actinobacteria bacterium RBG_16_67_15]|nr:MAG: hypothetical protein A2135_10350 [Actinobacteria bacterium RBG_16_67_15]
MAVTMSGFIAVSAIVVLFGFLVVVFWAANSRKAGERGWVYNRFNPRPRRTGTLGLLESIYQPSLEHVIEERSSEKARGDQAKSGDKPGSHQSSVTSRTQRILSWRLTADR